MNCRYRKKPVVIEAYQMTNERCGNIDDWPIWLNEAWQKACYEVNSVSPEGSLCGDKLIIKTEAMHAHGLELLLRRLT